MTEAEIITALREHPGITTREFAEKFSMKPTVAGGRLSRLYAYGRIDCERVQVRSGPGMGNRRYWCRWKAKP